MRSRRSSATRSRCRAGTGSSAPACTSTTSRSRWRSSTARSATTSSTTMWWIAGIAALGIALIGGSGLALNLSDARIADAKLRLLARQVVKSQEDERAHLSRELHDSTSQTLVSIKLLLESAMAQLDRARSPLPRAADQGAGPPERRAARGAQHLAPAAARRARRAGPAGGARAPGRRVQRAAATWRFSMRVRGAPTRLPDEVNTVLFRVAQEVADQHREARRRGARAAAPRVPRARPAHAADRRRRRLRRAGDPHRPAPRHRAAQHARARRVDRRPLRDRLAAGPARRWSPTSRSRAIRAFSDRRSARRRDEPSPLTRVLLVDDHPLVRDGLKARLCRRAGLEVVGEAGNANEAFDAVERACARPGADGRRHEGRQRHRADRQAAGAAIRSCGC